MLKWMKFILKLSKKQQIVLKEIIDKILSGNISGLDIKKLSGKDNFFRVRVGNIRLIYYIENGKNYIYDIDFRGGIYKGLK